MLMLKIARVVESVAAVVVAVIVAFGASATVVIVGPVSPPTLNAARISLSRRQRLMAGTIQQISRHVNSMTTDVARPGSMEIKYSGKPIMATTRLLKPTCCHSNSSNETD